MVSNLNFRILSQYSDLSRFTQAPRTQITHPFQTHIHLQGTNTFFFFFFSKVADQLSVTW